MYDIMVIGGGPAGSTAALRARELGAHTALIEGGRFGGTRTNDGCVPTRVLAQAPELFRDAGQASVDSPTTLRRADGRTIETDKAILAVGGHPKRLPIPGAELARTPNDVWSMSGLPHSVIVIGGGATGSQLASVFQCFGVKTTILDIMPTILPVEDREVSQAVHDGFRENGLQVLTGVAGVSSITGNDDQTLEISYTTGEDGAKRAMQADVVIMAAGWAGNTDGLGLENAGVQTEKSYVVVNDSMQSRSGPSMPPETLPAEPCWCRMQRTRPESPLSTPSSAR